MNRHKVIDLPYQTDSAGLMSALQQLPCPVFLDSSLSRNRNGRYDILMADPVATLTQSAGKINLWEQSASGPDFTEQISSQPDLFSAVILLLQQYAPTQSDPALTNLFAGLPFSGGAAGYFGYDLALPARKAAAKQEKNITPDGYIGIYLWAVIVDHQQKTTQFLYRDNCPEDKQKQALMKLQQNNGTSAVTSAFVLEKPFSSAITRKQYDQAFHRLKDYIDAGDCYQANLAQSFSSSYAGDPFDAYLQLRQKTHGPFSAFIRLPEASVLSFSPERFIRVNGTEVMTQPIKGTRPRDSDPGRDLALAEELRQSEKDQAENLMIVDLLRNDLSTLCSTGSVITRKLFELQSFSNVHHLVSTITGELPARHHPLALLRNCFPGGSITGAPKIRAMQIIAELESVSRQVYCGSVACIGFDGQMDTSITIRTLLCEQGKITCWAGGGIVADSEVGQEYQECLDKISVLINSLPCQGS